MAKTEYFQCRVKPGTKDALKAIAQALEMEYGGNPAPGQVLEAIAAHKDVLIPILKPLLKKVKDGG